MNHYEREAESIEAETIREVNRRFRGFAKHHSPQPFDVYLIDGHEVNITAKVFTGWEFTLTLSTGETITQWEFMRRNYKLVGTGNLSGVLR